MATIETGSFRVVPTTALDEHGKNSVTLQWIEERWTQEREASPMDQGTEEEKAAGEIQNLARLAETLGSFVVPKQRRVSFAVGFGWWLRTLRTADGIRLLHEAGLSQEASPLLRTILHHTGALEWLRLHPEEVIEALQEEHVQRQHDLAGQAARRDWDLAGLDLGQRPQKQKGLQYLRKFEEMCEHIGVGNLYVAYKLESAYAHPSALSADVYLCSNPDGLPELRDSPVVGGAPLKVTAVLAAVATRVLGEFIDDGRLVAAANRVGERLGVPTTVR